MKKTWRWFGRNDNITLSMLKEIGVEGIVTALHEIPNGEVWSLDRINELKCYIEEAGLEWSVVESLPVSEAIKYGGADRERLINNYIESLANLGKAGVTTVCYNFMPVIDWIRTDIDYKLADGSSTLFFDKTRFAYFDCYILKRKDAKKDYSAQELKQIAELDKTITEEEKAALIDTIIVKTQGFINGNIQEGEANPVAFFKNLLALYDGIDRSALRENLNYFLSRIMPVCDEYGINMCIHPDDPPFQMLGLPRIVTSEEDIDWIFNAVDNPHNGLTFCAGSLSSGAHNNVPLLAAKFLKMIHFVHLRSTEILPDGSFIEADHLAGRAKLTELVALFEKGNPSLPMRVDHGRLMAEDREKGYNPGYSFLGRKYALVQMSDVMTAVH